MEEQVRKVAVDNRFIVLQPLFEINLWPNIRISIPNTSPATQSQYFSVSTHVAQIAEAVSDRPRSRKGALRSNQ